MALRLRIGVGSTQITDGSNRIGDVACSDLARREACANRNGPV
jgi:hypothetical protein